MRALTPLAFSPPPVAAVPEEARVLLKAARLWVMLARSGRSARPPLAALLGPAAPRFALFMDAVVVAWHDPFTTFPPCSCNISPDEHCLLNMLALAEADMEPQFHDCLHDMLPKPERNRLWQAATRLMAERIGAG